MIIRQFLGEEKQEIPGEIFVANEKQYCYHT